MADRHKFFPELLAPAGSINVFEKAIEAGADAVYIGAPALNARALSRDFSLAEIAAMVDFAHEKGANIIHDRITTVEIMDGLPKIKTRKGAFQSYDLLTVAVGVNSSVAKLFEKLELFINEEEEVFIEECGELFLEDW